MGDTFKCSKCEKELDESSFYERPTYYIGGRRVSYDCKECRKKRRNRTVESWNTKLRKYKTLCKGCKNPKKVNKSNGLCNTCNRNQGMKECRACGMVKIIGLDFYKDKGVCWGCVPEEMTTRQARIDKRVEHNKLYGHLPREERELHSVLERKYGLSLNDYKQMMEDQGGKCAICNKEAERLCVDHDHRTGRVRKLLCNNCNVGLGNFKDDTKLLHKAMEYLGFWNILR